jgi:predicted DNA binding protein
MSVIAELSIPAHEFELGRILDIEGGTTIELEEMVPLGETAVPFFSLREGSSNAFEDSVRDHPSVDTLQQISTHEGEVFYSLGWRHERDLVFEGFLETGAHLLTATGHENNWEFELRFPGHDALSAFKEYCENAHVSLTVQRIYNPTKPGDAPWFGLTEVQRNTIMYAVDHGYYAIPREISTQELADEFGVSDQAVTERLRRATIALVENTLAVAAAEVIEAD